MGRHLVLVLVLAASGCTDEGHTLLVDVQSDLVPGVEATRIVTRLVGGLPEEGGGEERVLMEAVGPGDDLLGGVRVAELAGLAAGSWTLRVQLVDDSGRVQLERVALVRLDATTSVTLLMARSCQGVSCPAEGGDPRAIACLGGRCVRPECTPETPETCPPASCAMPTDCPAPVADCAMARCLRGECFAAGVDGRCGMDEACIPESGCQSLGAPTDAGAPDAGIPPAPAGTTERVLAVGGAGDEDGYDLAVDPASGNVIVVGQYQGTLDFGSWSISSNGGSDLFVVAFGPDGENLWSIGVGSAVSSQDRASGVAIDAAGNVYVAGYYASGADFGGGARAFAGTSDAFIASWDADGTYRWDWTLGGPDFDLIYDVAVAPDGSVWGAGYYTGANDAGGGPLPVVGDREALLVHLDGATGAHLGSLGIATAAGDFSRALTVDGAGNPTLGLEVGTYDFGGGQTVTGFGLASLTPDLAVRWTRTIGAGAAWGLEVASGDDVVVTGSVGSASDLGDGPVGGAGSSFAFVARYGSDGAARWARPFPATETSIGLGITVDRGDRVFAVGLAGADIDFGAGPQAGPGGGDAFVVGLAPGGELLFGNLYGDTMQDRGHGIVAHPDGRIFATGRFAGTVDFGDGSPRPAVGMDDFFLIEIR